MHHGAPQFTPRQLLEAAHRAEAEGRADLAAQFYQYLVEQFALSSEAAEARDGLGRVAASPQLQHVWHPNGNGSPAVVASRTERGSRRVRYPAPRDHYRTGRLLAKLFSAVGWCAVLTGFVLAPLAFVTPILMPYGALAVLGSAAGLLLMGLLTIASGQAARALFDQANAARELVAIERARASIEV